MAVVGNCTLCGEPFTEEGIADRGMIAYPDGSVAMFCTQEMATLYANTMAGQLRLWHAIVARLAEKLTEPLKRLTDTKDDE